MAVEKSQKTAKPEQTGSAVYCGEETLMQQTYRKKTKKTLRQTDGGLGKKEKSNLFSRTDIFKSLKEEFSSLNLGLVSWKKARMVDRSTTAFNTSFWPRLGFTESVHEKKACGSETKPTRTLS